MHLLRAGLLGICLAACSQKAPPAENQTVNETLAAEASNSSAALPPANSEPRFVGTWAGSAAECKTKAWHFTKDSVTAEDGPKCSFYKVSKAPGGYDIAAECPAKEPEHTDLIRLRFAESAKAMLVESNAISPRGLVYCGE